MIDGEAAPNARIPRYGNSGASHSSADQVINDTAGSEAIAETRRRGFGISGAFVIPETPFRLQRTGECGVIEQKLDLRTWDARFDASKRDRRFSWLACAGSMALAGMLVLGHGSR